MFHTKTGAAGLSILSNSLLVLIKIVVGVLSGSVSIVAEAIHSGFDLIAAGIAYFSLRIAGRPADREHPFGHGKVENISGTIEAALIFAAAAFIIYESVARIISGAEVEYVTAAIAVMAVSLLVNVFVSRHLLRIARETDSIALEADGRHLSTDVYTSLGVLLGLALVHFTGLNILDPIVALGVALYILKMAYDLIRRAFPPLMDVRLPREDESLIESIVRERSGEVVALRGLRTRKAGSERYIELTLAVARDASVERAHALCDQLEDAIGSRLPNAHVTIHIEPCDEECDECPAECPPDQQVPGP